MQRFDLDRIAAPDRSQGLEFAQGLGLIDLAALLPQRDLEQLGFGRGRAIGRVHREFVFVERILVVRERLGEPAAQHR